MFLLSRERQRRARHSGARRAVLVAVAVVTATLASSVLADVRPPHAAADESAQTDAAPPTRVAVVGDSFSQGPGDGYRAVLTRRFGWQITNLSEGSSGYLLGGNAGGPPFAERVARELKDDFQIVLLAGGLNDAKRTEDVADGVFATAVGRTITAVRAASPDARIVVLGPFSPTGPADPTVVAVDHELQRVAAEEGVDFVDTLRPLIFTGRFGAAGSGNAPTLISDDTTHPTAEGFEYLGERLAERLQRLPYLLSPGRIRISAVAVDTSVGLEAIDLPGRSIQHSGRAVRLGAVEAGSSSAVRRAGSWSVRTGLASSKGVSFESLDRPGYYLAAPGALTGKAKLAENDGSRAFAGRATFHWRTSGTVTSFAVWANRSLRLQHRGSELVVTARGTAERAPAGSSFAIRAGSAAATPVPLTAGRTIGLESADSPGRRVGHMKAAVSLLEVGRGSGLPRRSGTSWVVRTGLGSKQDVSFESVDQPGWFLVAPAFGPGTAKLVRRTGSRSFLRRATFRSIADTAGAITLTTAGGSGRVLQVDGTRIVVRTPDGGGADPAASFTVRTGSSPARLE